MIATSRKSASRPAVSRQYEFSRLQEQTLASAYETLIPVVARRPECRPHRRADRDASTSVRRSPQRSVAGA
jgi:hypothetical protein